MGDTNGNQSGLKINVITLVQLHARRVYVGCTRFAADKFQPRKAFHSKQGGHLQFNMRETNRCNPRSHVQRGAGARAGKGGVRRGCSGSGCLCSATCCDSEICTLLLTGIAVQVVTDGKKPPYIVDRERHLSRVIRFFP